jgi:anti-anti-sigma factor
MAPTAFLSLTASREGPMAFARRGPPDVVVCLRGEHDLSTVAELSATMARAITLSDADLVVDLSRVEFMSASTVNVVVWARELLRARHRSLAVRTPSRCARRVLELCDLSDLIDPRFAERPMTRAAAALGTWVPVPAIEGIDRRLEASVLDSLPAAAVAGSVVQQPSERPHRTTARRAGRRALRGRLPSGSPVVDPGPDHAENLAG